MQLSNEWPVPKIIFQQEPQLDTSVSSLSLSKLWQWLVELTCHFNKELSNSKL